MTKSDTGSELVFVYGSLRRGASKAYRLAEAEFVAPGLVRGKLFEDAGFAGLVLDVTGGFVAGDLYRLSDDQIARLGAIEGAPESTAYRKILARVHPHNLGQAPLEAWLWEWNGSTMGRKALDPGDWLDHERPRATPWCTGIAIVCLFFFPVGLIAAFFMAQSLHASASGRDWTVFVVMAYGYGAILSPPVGLVAAILGSRRRERWMGPRAFVLCVLALASIPALILLCSGVAEAVESLF